MAVDADLGRHGHVGGAAHGERTLVPRRAPLAPLVEAVAVQLGDPVARDPGEPVDAVRVLADEMLENAELDEFGERLVRVRRAQGLEVQPVLGCLRATCT